MAFQAQTAGRGVGQLLSSRAGRGEAYFVGVPTGPCLNFPVLCSFYFYKISKVRLETNNYIIKTIFKSRDTGDKGSCYFLLRGRSPCLWLTVLCCSVPAGRGLRRKGPLVIKWLLAWLVILRRDDGHAWQMAIWR